MLGDILEAERVPVIDSRLKRQLDAIEPTLKRSCEFRPCCIKFVNGRWRDRVYLVEAVSYVKWAGMWPWEISGAAYPSDRDISINEVIEN